MKLTTFIFTFFVLCATTFCQKEVKKDYYQWPKRYASMQILGHSIVSYNFEHSIISHKGFALMGELGIGLAEFSDSESTPPIPATYAFHFWLPIQYSFKGVELIACVAPSLYQHGKLGFIDINGNFGIRTNFSNKRFTQGIFLAAYYTPKIHQSLSNPNSVYTHFPMAVKIGAAF